MVLKDYDFFKTYTPVFPDPVPIKEIENPLGNFKLNDYFVGFNLDLIPIAKDVVTSLVNSFNSPKEDNLEYYLINNNNSSSTKEVNTPLEFNKLLDEVSNEKGFENLKDSEFRNLITLQAARESDFKLRARSSSSTASGYFQFIDSTRKKYSNYSKELFLDDPKELIRAAVKHLKDILDSTNALKLLKKGYNKKQISALGWWYPKSMDMVLNGKTNFSLGGYSIKQALLNYA